ncbi:ribosomal RNA small subunit methyltransferase G [Lapidilactobacillus concavus]|nr:16S rRNA (guanine(527)-N(7))-methyltransferase RsmG [Lapidilactobacillus concavus]MCH4056388.1 16S rRNA (guanine(527)-N(7))-methyltransferase RsmG [Lactobacillaceae bacterium]GEL12785.1 ribosomal RNA small subunit methyltransferase G [Lapidilactobacillus concavus]
MSPDQFYQQLASQGISLTEMQKKQFMTYYELLVETNKVVNLTAITAKDDVYLKHFYDSLTLAFALPELQTEAWSLLDVGAGAGFPSIPNKIVFPQLQVSIVDSLNKRIKFLQELATQLDLEGVAFYHARAEDFGNKRSEHRQSYNVVTARAVASLPVLAELCLPLVEKGGYFVAMKGSKGSEELAQSAHALNILGGKLVRTVELTLPQTNDQRVIIIVKKTKETPKTYPRKPGTITKSPLLGELLK